MELVSPMVDYRSCSGKRTACPVLISSASLHSVLPPADTGKEVRRLVRLPIKKEDFADLTLVLQLRRPTRVLPLVVRFPSTTASETGVLPPTPARRSLPISRSRRHRKRAGFGSWTATAAGTTPRNPNRPAPSTEPGKPPGIVTGQPMPLWITPPPIFDFSDRSAASRSNSDQFPSRADGVRSSNKPRASVFDTRAPAVPFVAPYERFASGSLNGSSAPLSADDAANAPNAPIGHSGLRSVNNDDELSWLIQRLSRRQR